MEPFLSEQRRRCIFLDLPEDLASQAASVPDEVDRVFNYLGRTTMQLHKNCLEFVTATHADHIQLKATIAAEILIVAMFAAEIVERRTSDPGSMLQ